MTEGPHDPPENSQQQEPVSEPHAPPPEDARLPPLEMRLRTERPRVTRLSRRVLAGAGAIACGGIVIALSVALWPHRQTAAPQTVSTGANIFPEGMASLPKDYTAAARAPKLGPPLPGDLGKPMLKAGVAAPGMPVPATPEQLRIAQQRDAARTSHLFATSNVTQTAAPATTTAAASAPRSPRHLANQPTRTTSSPS